MAAPFTCDDQVSIERLIKIKEPVYGTEKNEWVPLHAYFWANVQDVLPSRAEATANGLTVGVTRSRLRIRGAFGVDMTMRVVLHSRGARVMQIIAGPARLDDGVYEEFMLEAYGGANG
jgi:head-tail adaptor